MLLLVGSDFVCIKSATSMHYVNNLQCVSVVMHLVKMTFVSMKWALAGNLCVQFSVVYCYHVYLYEILLWCAVSCCQGCSAIGMPAACCRQGCSAVGLQLGSSVFLITCSSVLQLSRRWSIL